MKNILKSLAIVAVVTIAGYNVSQFKVETEGMSDTMLANVEALARVENDLCPNGCVEFGTGCYCNGWYPTLKEYSW